MVGRTLVPGLASCRAESGPVMVGLLTDEDISRKMLKAIGRRALTESEVKQVSRTGGGGGGSATV